MMARTILASKTKYSDLEDEYKQVLGKKAELGDMFAQTDIVGTPKPKKIEVQTFESAVQVGIIKRNNF